VKRNLPETPQEELIMIAFRAPSAMPQLLKQPTSKLAESANAHSLQRMVRSQRRKSFKKKSENKCCNAK
jgi:hypothetical protein